MAEEQTQKQERRQSWVGISPVHHRGVLLHPAWITLSQPVLYLAFVCSFLSLLLLATGEDSSSLSHAQSPVMSLSQRPVPRILPSTTPTGAILLLPAQKPRRGLQQPPLKADPAPWEHLQDVPVATASSLPRGAVLREQQSLLPVLRSAAGAGLGDLPESCQRGSFSLAQFTP